MNEAMLNEEKTAHTIDEKVTLKTIAEHVGTSLGTVDRAINGRAGISDEMRDAVLSTADKLGYEAKKRSYSPRRKGRLRIAVAYPELPDSFYRVMDAGVTAAQRKYAADGIIVDKIRYHNPAPNEALERLDSLNVNDYDAVALVSSGAQTNVAIERFALAGLPVVTINSDANFSSRKTFIGTDAYQSGCIAAEMLGLLMRGQGAIIAYIDLGQTTPGIVRFTGLNEYMRVHYPDIEVLSCIDDTSESMEKSAKLESMINLSASVSGIFCTGASSTLIVANTLKMLDRRDISVIGYDISPSIYAALRDRWCSALIFQDPFRQGYLAVKLLVEHLRRGAELNPKDGHIDNIIVTRANVDRYYDTALFENSNGDTRF